MSNQILNFKQGESEPFYKAWERFTSYYTKCPHHNMSQYQLIKSFISGLKTQDRHWLDACANGSILDLEVDESFEFIQKIAMNDYDSKFDRNPQLDANSISILTRKDKDIWNVDRMSELEDKIKELRAEISKVRQDIKKDQVSWIDSDNRLKNNTEKCYFLNSVSNLANRYDSEPEPEGWEKSIETLCNQIGGLSVIGEQGRKDSKEDRDEFRQSLTLLQEQVNFFIGQIDFSKTKETQIEKPVNEEINTIIPYFLEPIENLRKKPMKLKFKMLKHFRLTCSKSPRELKVNKLLNELHKLREELPIAKLITDIPQFNDLIRKIWKIRNKSEPVKEINLVNQDKIDREIDEIFQRQKPELKNLPNNLKYLFLDDEGYYPVIINASLDPEQEIKVKDVLNSHRSAIGWSYKDLKGISSRYCMHKILFEEGSKPIREPQQRLNPNLR